MARQYQAHAERSAGTRKELEAQVADKVKEMEREKESLEKKLKEKEVQYTELKGNMQQELKVRAASARARLPAGALLRRVKTLRFGLSSRRDS